MGSLPQMLRLGSTLARKPSTRAILLKSLDLDRHCRILSPALESTTGLTTVEVQYILAAFNFLLALAPFQTEIIPWLTTPAALRGALVEAIAAAVMDPAVETAHEAFSAISNAGLHMGEVQLQT